MFYLVKKNPQQPETTLKVLIWCGDQVTDSHMTETGSGFPKWWFHL